MPRRSRLLTDVLRHPDEVLELTAPQWDLLIRQARATQLLGQLDWRIERAGLQAVVPAGPHGHLRAARRLAEAQADATARLIAHWRGVLRAAPSPFALVGGAGWLVTASPLAEGRWHDALEVLLPRERLAAVEDALAAAGWQAEAGDDDRHCWGLARHTPDMAPRHAAGQAPALPQPRTLPGERMLMKLDASRRFGAALPALHSASVAIGGLLADGPPPPVLSPVDGVLYLVARLFERGQTATALRDLVDLDLLLRDHGRAHGFWPALIARSQRLQLQRALHLALRYARRLLGTPAPRAAMAAGQRHAPWPVVQQALDACWLTVLAPPLPRPHPEPARRLAQGLIARGFTARAPSRSRSVRNRPQPV